MWIGNLPPQANLMDLVDHVCKETEGLDSLFLISKSNCAFANFQDETSCLAALRKLHDSRFLTVRLVCRLRKSTVEGPAGAVAPTGPASSAPQAVGGPQPTTVHDSSGNTDGDEESDAVAAPPSTVAPETEAAALSTNGRTTQTERFFVLKSLTVEDLELSVRTKLWATQAHNEEALNSAFQVSDRCLGCRRKQKEAHADRTRVSGADRRQRVPRIFSEQIWRVLWLRPDGVGHQRRPGGRYRVLARRAVGG